MPSSPYTVSQRRREIGIRIALGARAVAVAGSVLKESLAVLIVGAVTGLLVGLSAERLIRSFLFEVSGTDPGVLGAATLAFVITCSLAAVARVARAIRPRGFSAPSSLEVYNAWAAAKAEAQAHWKL